MVIAANRSSLTMQIGCILSSCCPRKSSNGGWLLYAFCLMDNHYHLLLETPQSNLVRGLRLLNGGYTQAFNRAHGLVGHLLQGRYKSILVAKDAYLREL